MSRGALIKERLLERDCGQNVSKNGFLDGEIWDVDVAYDA